MTNIKIQTGSPKFPVTKELYGLFYEDLNRCGDGGMYPEMIRNRTFEDSLMPENCEGVDGDTVYFVEKTTGHTTEFNHGEGLTRWLEPNGIIYTPIPGWYADGAQMELDAAHVLNANRETSLCVNFTDGGSIHNVGYQGISVKAGEAYPFYMFAYADADSLIRVKLAAKDGEVYAEKTFDVKSNGYARYDCTFVSAGTDQQAIFVVEAPKACCLHLGFVSLMPAETYNGHGLRKDLVEKLAALKPAFLRYPGGGFAEGFNFATIPLFSRITGPVWERPSFWNMWNYRTTNGFGYHEFLQLCEDLNMKKLYVANCGIGDVFTVVQFFKGEQKQQILDEAIAAIEYAIAPVGTKYGDMRAAAGHPEPFGLDYVEIGNESYCPEYYEYYKWMYEALKPRYPDITFLTCLHVEEQGLPAEIVDEHYYSTPEFFAENVHRYDSYPRTGPGVFIGECAVTQGQPGTLRAALGEAMFWMGLEKNQDICRLACYAPLFENVTYYKWYPNLICFDNTTSYGIPSWHMLKLMGANRGTDFLDAAVETGVNYKSMTGIFSVNCSDAFSFRSAKVDGAAVGVSHELRGSVKADGDGFVTVPQDPDGSPLKGPSLHHISPNMTAMTFGEELKEAASFEISIWFKDELDIQAFVNNGGRPEWSARTARGFSWKITSESTWAQSSASIKSEPLSETTALSLTEGWHDFKVVSYVGGFDCYIDGALVVQAKLPSYPSVEAVADTDDEHVIVKIVNFTELEEDITIDLDIDVQSDYTVKLLTGEALAENHITDPEHVKDVEFTAQGAAKQFVYKAPANSLSVLILQK